ncbi:MAG: tetratricopeptide repeat protein [Verrucomicrobiaceae bacterium]|nr:tetratricopeptide repeat protein [Verrucomicrobiaceae bacterium]
MNLRVVVGVVFCLWVADGLAFAQDKKGAEWSDKDTRLATEYLELLVDSPEYGRVVDLLWDLYQQKDSTKLLLENVHAQATASGHAHLLLVEAHLVRRSGDLKKAADLYDAILKTTPDLAPAMQARADVAIELGDSSRAIMLLQKLAVAIAEPSIWLRVAELELALAKVDNAARAWEEALKLRPQDLELARNVAQHLLRAGLPERAEAHLLRLSQSAPPAQRIDALLDLARVREHADRAKEADSALSAALEMVDFRDARYAEIFRRRVRLHERFGTLEQFKDACIAAAKRKEATERELFDASRVHELTAEADEQIVWLRALVKHSPETGDYRWELVRALLDHEGAAEAARLLDEHLSSNTASSPAVILLRAEADLRLSHAQEGSRRLLKLLEEHPNEGDIEKQVLAFAQERSLDDVLQHIYEARLNRSPNQPEAVYALAGFHRSRNRVDDAGKLLRTFADSASDPVERARRLAEAAAFMASAGSRDEALKLQEEAVKLAGNQPEVLLRLADMMLAGDESNEALPKLEAAVAAARSLEERTDIDERLYALLAGTKAQAKIEPTVSITSGDFRLPSYITGDGFGSGEPVEEKKMAPSEAVQEYAENLVEAARQPNAKEAVVQRAVWWAQRAGMSEVVYELLRRLLLRSQSEPVPVVDQRFYLDIVLAEEDRFFARRLLLDLLQRDATNSMQYLLRLAEIALADQRPDRAITHLQDALKQHPDSEPLLNALSQCFMLSRKVDAAVVLWPAAIKRANGAAAAAMRERYSELLLRVNRLPAYIEVQVDQLEAEADIKKRREVFKRFLDRVTYSDPVGGELAANVMQDRLKQIETRLLERANRHPFDGFYQEALAAIFDRRGDSNRAFQAMKQAYYTSPDAAFSLENLRDAAVKSGDQKAAIYFQKQVAAYAPASEQAAEARRLVQMLESAFQMAEADKVRRRLENRFSQDPVALEDLARHYSDTGQLEAERRVYEQIKKVKAWDARGTLRLALTCLALGDEPAAIAHLNDLLSRTTARNSLKSLPPERWPYPLTDERKNDHSGTLSEIVSLLEETQHLAKDDKERLRTFLSYPRPEFARLPDDVSLVRLRAIEELARLTARNGEQALRDWIDRWDKDLTSPEIERLWALYYANANKELHKRITAILGDAETLDARFVYVWVCVRSNGMSEAVRWLERLNLRAEGPAKARAVIQTALEILTATTNFRFTEDDIRIVGRCQLFNTQMLEQLVKELQQREQYREAMALTECLRDRSPDLHGTYSFALASFAESAEDWQRQRAYLMDVIEGPLAQGFVDNNAEDPFLRSVVALYRLMRTPQERQAIVLKADQRLQKAPDTSFNRMRRSALASLFGADGFAARKLADMAGGPLLSARPIIDPSPQVMPQSLSRGDSSHLRGYWEEVRLLGSILGQQGFGEMVADMDNILESRIGGAQLGPRPSDSFGQWRMARLIRELREASFPERQRMIREYLASVDMKEEDSVETLTDLGRELEVHGFVRECIEVYQGLPGRAPTNTTFAEYYIRVCEQGMEPEPGRAYVASLFGKDPVYKPQGLGDETLREKHARFLAMKRDFAGLRAFGFRQDGQFSKVLTGRIPPEAPYLRELALLLERDGDQTGALAIWDRLELVFRNGTPDSPPPPDVECAVHRVKLNDALGTKGRAHAIAVEVDVKTAVDDLNLELLKLRSQLAANLGKWDDMQKLMALAVTQKSVPFSVHLGMLLEKHQRRNEALSFLTQAERSSKDAVDRFQLRLEFLQLLALDSKWSPQTSRPQIAVLFRGEVRDKTTLEALLSWLRQQSSSSNAASWVELLKAETRAAPDKQVAALALSAFATHLPPGQLPVEFSRTWKIGGEQDRICMELTAFELHRHKRFQWAQQVCDVLAAIPGGTDPRLLPVSALVAGGLGDRALQDELFAEITQYSLPGGQRTLEWAAAFEQIGRPDLAREVFDLSLRRISRAYTPGADLIRSYSKFLIKQRDFEGAERLLMKHYATFLQDAAGPVIDLYTAWGREKSIRDELPKFFMPEGLLIEIQYRLGQKW